MNLDEARQQRINDCRELYLKYEGQHDELIEQEMRARGHHDFHRRSLYRRFERGRCREGWIGQYGFDSLVREQKRRGQDRAGAAYGGTAAVMCGKARPFWYSPPYEGGVAAASADGVVLSTATDQRGIARDVENHPVGETPTPLLRKEGSLACSSFGRADGVVLSTATDQRGIDGDAENHLLMESLRHSATDFKDPEMEDGRAHIRCFAKEAKVKADDFIVDLRGKA